MNFMIYIILKILPIYILRIFKISDIKFKIILLIIFMDKKENINKIDPPKGNTKGSDPEVYGNYVRGNFGKNMIKTVKNN